jgi:4-aminobutyrate aminotransferase-like enzyme
LSSSSYWTSHESTAPWNSTSGFDVNRPLDARRCTVQLSTGRLYLDAVASPATALLGHDLPPMPLNDAASVEHMLSSLEPGYDCLAMTPGLAAAVEFAATLSRSHAGEKRRVIELNALDGEPAASDDFLVVHENETLGRTGRWLASTAWTRTPDLVVIGDALALGHSFGAVLGRIDHAPKYAADPAALPRVAAAIATVEREGLLQQGQEVAVYLRARLLSVRDTCPEIELVEGLGLSIRVAFAAPLAATQIRRRMCERGVLVGVDRQGRLAIDPPLPLRIAEADVITGALRGSILGLPMVSASPCCAACEAEI